MVLCYLTAGIDLAPADQVPYDRDVIPTYVLMTLKRVKPKAK